MKTLLLLFFVIATVAAFGFGGGGYGGGGGCCCCCPTCYCYCGRKKRDSKADNGNLPTVVDGDAGGDLCPRKEWSALIKTHMIPNEDQASMLAISLAMRNGVDYRPNWYVNCTTQPFVEPMPEGNFCAVIEEGISCYVAAIA